MKKIFSILLLVVCLTSFGQTQLGDSSRISYSSPKEYTIAMVDFPGLPASYDREVLKVVAGLLENDRILIPGDKISTAIENLWKQGLFEDVRIDAEKIMNDQIWLNIHLVEKPRLNSYKFSPSISKSEGEDIAEKNILKRDKPLTDHYLAEIKAKLKEFYIDKGYLDADVSFSIEDDAKARVGYKQLVIKITKGKKVRISDIVINGNNEDVLSDRKLRKGFKETKRRRWYTIFTQSKFIRSNYEKELPTIVDKYNSKGYRDAKIVKDTIIRESDNRLRIEITVDEGRKYYFRNITWVGNTKYNSKVLSNVLGIKKGDVYNEEALQMRLQMSPNGTDVSSLYMDDGYLFFQVIPVETQVVNDSIDFEMRIYEGRQAIINKVTVVGNTKTNDHVILREIRTKPGELFRRSEIVRSQRELAYLGLFDPEKLNVNPKPNAAEGTVDIEYIVEEKPSDQIELSGGWGGGRVVGTVGVSFNNFSSKNLFNKNAWRPLPAGDAQKLSIRAQSNGLYYQSYNFSFVEPWFGGRKPNSFSVSIFHSVQSNGQPKKIENSLGEKIDNTARRSLLIYGGALGFGQRLKRPDDYFQTFYEASYQYYVLNNFSNIFSFPSGYSNNASFRATLSRNSINKSLMEFPTVGSIITLSGQLTPPWSKISGKDLSNATDQEKFKWIEYYKIKFTTNWFTKLAGGAKHPLVLNARAGFGYLGHYNSQIGTSPFERFYLGGGGLTGYALDGREIIALRGYDDQSLSPRTGASIISKYTFELRYPVSLNPQAMVYGLGFVEGGNSWTRFRDFNPFDVKRSAGVGVRVMLPMFGLLGLDYGWRLDNVSSAPLMQRGQLHFTIGANLGEL